MQTSNALAPDHPERLAALRRYGVFRSDAQASHQRALELALKAVQAPVGMINLVGETSLRIVAVAGHPILTTTRKLPFRLDLVLNNRFVQTTDRAIMQVVNDLFGSAEASGFAFYASVPLYTIDQQVLGNLCILDRVPRALSPQQAQVLEDIASALIHELDLRLEIWTLRQKLDAQEAQHAPGERILESISQALIAENLDGTVMHWNLGATHLLGFNATEMLGRAAADLIPAEERPVWQERVQKTLNGVRLEPFETVRLHKDGHPLRLEVSLSPIRGPSDRIIGLSSLITRVVETAPLVQATLEPGLRGTLESIGGAATLTQMLAITGHSGMLQLGLAHIYLRSGRVIHIQHPSLEGGEAVIESLRVAQGYFEYTPDAVPERTTLNLDLTSLALEAARRSDEASSLSPVSQPDTIVQGIVTLPNVLVALDFIAGVGGNDQFVAALEPVGLDGVPHVVLIGRGLKVIVQLGSLSELPASIRRR